MSTFTLRIASGGVFSHTSRESVVEYHGQMADVGIAAALQSLEEMAHDRASLPVVCACLEQFAPELMAIAAVLVINQLPKMEDDDALPLLRKMREIGQPEWVRTIAGNLLMQLDDQHAVCDASEVVG